MNETLDQAADLGPCRGRIPNLSVKLRVEAFEPCPIHGHTHQPCNCEKKSIGVVEKEHDLMTKQFAQLIMLNILNSNQTIKDTSAASNAETANTSSGTITIAAGTGGTTATVVDYQLGTETETVAAGAPSAFSGTGSSGTFTVAGTVTATSSRAYIECGLKVTVNSHVYLICRDSFSTLNVSNGGTLAVTYTFTLS